MFRSVIRLCATTTTTPKPTSVERYFMWAWQRGIAMHRNVTIETTTADCALYAHDNLEPNTLLTAVPTNLMISAPTASIEQPTGCYLPAMDEVVNVLRPLYGHDLTGIEEEADRIRLALFVAVLLSAGEGENTALWGWVQRHRNIRSPDEAPGSGSERDDTVLAGAGVYSLVQDKLGATTTLPPLLHFLWGWRIVSAYALPFVFEAADPETEQQQQFRSVSIIPSLEGVIRCGGSTDNSNALIDVWPRTKLCSYLAERPEAVHDVALNPTQNTIGLDKYCVLVSKTAVSKGEPIIVHL
eukprot:PhM_4_TR8694/c0_g1_i1/m.80457